MSITNLKQRWKFKTGSVVGVARLRGFYVQSVLLRSGQQQLLLLQAGSGRSCQCMQDKARPLEWKQFAGNCFYRGWGVLEVLGKKRRRISESQEGGCRACHSTLMPIVRIVAFP